MDDLKLRLGRIQTDGSVEKPSYTLGGELINPNRPDAYTPRGVTEDGRWFCWIDPFPAYDVEAAIKELSDALSVSAAPVPQPRKVSTVKPESEESANG